MHMASALLPSAISFVGTGLTLALFASPWKSLSEASKLPADKLESKIPHFSILCMSVNCLLWWTYSICVNDTAVFITNGCGFFLSLYYNYWYFKLSDAKDRVVRSASVGLLVYIAAIGGILLMSPPEDSISNLGLVCAGFSVLLYGSPLVKMGETIRTKNADNIPALMCIMGAASSLAWWAYGSLVGNKAISYPNCLGFVLACIQIVLVVMYSSGKKRVVSVASGAALPL